MILQDNDEGGGMSYDGYWGIFWAIDKVGVSKNQCQLRQIISIDNEYEYEYKYDYEYGGYWGIFWAIP